MLQKLQQGLRQNASEAAAASAVAAAAAVTDLVDRALALGHLLEDDASARGAIAELRAIPRGAEATAVCPFTDTARGCTKQACLFKH